MSPSSRPHHVLVVGAGSIGERHLRCFGATGRARVFFVEVNPELRATIANRYPGTTAYDSLDAAIEQPIDAAVVATPAPLHIPQATQLVERGVHVLIEKPLSVSLDGVDALQGLVAKKNVVAAVAYVLRAQPALAEMREAILGGRFGKPLQLVHVSGQNFPFFRPAVPSAQPPARHPTSLVSNAVDADAALDELEIPEGISDKKARLP